MRKVDEQLAQSFEGLKGNPHFQRIVQWLQDSLADERAANDQREGNVLAWGQGHAQTLAEILSGAESARKDLAAIRAAKDRPRPTV